MPELPEVETIALQLRPIISVKTVKDVTVLWPRTVYEEVNRFKETLIGNRITGLERRGKFLCLFLEDGQCVTIHLRMTGKLLFKPNERDRKYTRVIFRFTDGTSLFFVDIRKFGRMKLWPANEPLLPQLGPEPLEEKNVLDVLVTQKSQRAIKTLLLDQGVLAGIGNIYADEALFKAGIHPLTPADSISRQKLKRLAMFVPEILKAAINNNGTTISDYRSADQSAGRNQFFLNVYGRTDEPCPVCGNPIARLRINQRSSHYCPKCQGAKRSVKKGSRR
jgi:formamidopyrimidine-DNA glycosylase